jgi:competence protein ComEC
VRVDTLAVGDGTCHLVRSGRGALLWDCGSLTPGVGRLLVPRAVRALGASTVPTVVITHPNLDHFNGVLDIAEPLRIQRVIVGQAFLDHAAAHPRGGEAYTLAELARRGVEVRVVAAGERVDVGGVPLEFISPPRNASWAEDNNRSLAGVIGGAAPGRADLLLCGDIEAEAIGWIRAQRPSLRAAVMEAPHHGSANEAAMAWVESVAPRVVVQSTGPGRAGDERWAAVRAGRAWWCTAVDGACWAEVTADGGVRSGAFVAAAR